jgi:hypothetical protein
MMYAHSPKALSIRARRVPPSTMYMNRLKGFLPRRPSVTNFPDAKKYTSKRELHICHSKVCTRRFSLRLPDLQFCACPELRTSLPQGALRAYVSYFSFIIPIELSNAWRPSAICKHPTCSFLASPLSPPYHIPA